MFVATSTLTYSLVNIVTYTDLIHVQACFSGYMYMYMNSTFDKVDVQPAKTPV